MMEELLELAKKGEGELLLAFAVLLGLSPEQVDRIIKSSRETKTLELENEEEEGA